MIESPLVEVSGLRVSYPSRSSPALAGVDLEVRDGEQVLVVGPSGSGKSTLLHTLCGFVPGSVDAEVEGRVRVDRLSAPDTPVPELTGIVGLLGQDPPSQVCLPRVDDELAFVLENRATSPETIGPRVTRALQQVGLSHLADRRTGQLSGGELQRVALAATLLGDPRLLVLDEPTALLDPVAARRVNTLLTAARRTERPATIMVEHRLEELAHLPERVLLLDAGGRLVAAGPTGTVFAEHGHWLAQTGSWLPLAVELALALDGVPLLAEAERIVAGPGEALRLAGVDQRLQALAGATSSGAAGPSVARVAANGAGTVALEASDASFASAEGHVLVRDVDLRLRGGSVTAVIGANGSGKTSLLLGLAGLLRRVAGALEGEPAGMVFQHPEDQFVGRTVAGDVAYGLAARPERDPHRSDQARVRATLERFDLATLADVDPYRLSGGQKRRLSVAAMAVLEQPVLLLDEPTFGQDRANAAAMGQVLRSLASDGTAVVLATHDLRLVGRVADRVVVVANGAIMAQGTPERLLADDGLLAAAGLLRPALLDWWAERPQVPLRGLLDALELALPASTALADPA